jgi:hypothetical protein
MKCHAKFAVALVFGLMAVETRGQPPTTSNPPTPTDAAIIETCGGRLKKVFAQYGPPQDVYASGGEKNDSVTLDYGPFAFQVREKIVRICFFRSQWKGAIKGIKIGDTRDSVVKAMGEKYTTAKNADEVDDYAWELKDQDADLWVIFDKESKVASVQVELK